MNFLTSVMVMIKSWLLIYWRYLIEISTISFRKVLLNNILKVSIEEQLPYSIFERFKVEPSVVDGFFFSLLEGYTSAYNILHFQWLQYGCKRLFQTCYITESAPRNIFLEFTTLNNLETSNVAWTQHDTNLPTILIWIIAFQLNLYTTHYTTCIYSYHYEVSDCSPNSRVRKIIHQP